MGVDAEHRFVVSTTVAETAAETAPEAEPRVRPVPRTILIVGGGPAGLFAAEWLSAIGHHVTIVERMPSVGRKLMMAGRGGLNLTHSEGLKDFLTRYGAEAKPIVSAIHRFRPKELIAWADELGAATFEGTSGRIFPKAMKASPLLRAWLKRLSDQGVTLITGERWIGWDTDGAMRFERIQTGAPAILTSRRADAVILALGGASWPRLGADGGWTHLLEEKGITVKPWQPANAGVLIPWSPFIGEKFAGAPLKRLGLTVGRGATKTTEVLGEAVVTRTGLEGGAIYAIGAALRATMTNGSPGQLRLDLKPGMTAAELTKALAKPRGKQTMANHLRKAVGLPPVMVALLHEGHGRTLPTTSEALAAAIKDVALPVTGFAGLERAISSAGGIALDEIDENFMLTKCPGVFVAGEMLDWEAPTGGYLLQACFATGKAAAEGVERWVSRK